MLLFPFTSLAKETVTFVGSPDEEWEGEETSFSFQFLKNLTLSF